MGMWSTTTLSVSLWLRLLSREAAEDIHQAGQGVFVLVGEAQLEIGFLAVVFEGAGGPFQDIHLHIRKTAPPQVKYHGAQKIAYTLIIAMGLGSVLTGLAIYKPVQFGVLTSMFGGYGNARVIHFVLTIGYCLFFLVHVIQVILAGWDNFRAMVTGFSVVRDADPRVDPRVNRQITRRSFVSFSVFTLMGVAAWKSWFWLKDSGEREGVQAPLRRGLNADEAVFRPTLSPDHLAPTFPTSAAARMVRPNGNVGLGNNGFDAAAWCLNVTKANGETLEVPLAELQTLPKTDYAFEFKCIEGWSQISWWGGVRFSDFVKHYHLRQEVALGYVGFETPDDQYYVGIDTPSAMHPQTLLCYEMNGKPLPANHGAPLRLIIPIKYGVKNLKRIGKMSFSNERPKDYWFERGYDYYCGL